MTTYKIIERNDDSTYCIVTRDDGTTFGQIIFGDESKTLAGIEKSIQFTISRVEKLPVVVESGVLDAISMLTEITLEVELGSLEII